MDLGSEADKNLLFVNFEKNFAQWKHDYSQLFTALNPQMLLDCTTCHFNHSTKDRLLFKFSLSSFLDDIDRIGSPSYVPTEQDILRLRIATTGINEVEFTMKNTKYRVFDVGGQRSERRKWIHCFDNVNAVIYVAALSDYNLTLAEDNHTNRLQESVKLFETICNSKWFLSTPMLLFLNKRDLFVDKIKTHPLTMAFPEYTGPQTYEDGVSYVHKKFTGVNRQPNREIYVHKTCATDTKDMEFVFDACFDIISQLSMQRSGLI
uniref:Uncharacterized protein n=1 Tax=Romanomermis culicivorax TaxID=13658 RepID=A0A915KJ36_ROMCU